MSIVIAPQAGPQTSFLSSSADIAIYGGAAGGGKTFALLLDPLRHVGRERFAGVFFRRNTPQIDNPGGLWDASTRLYPTLRARPVKHRHSWVFRSGAVLRMSHLEYDKSVENWQGSEIPFIGFDELTHFTEFQFFYLVSRNRGTSGVRPYIRATCNPDADSWVARFIAWWIDQTTGFAIPERAGVVRWFVRVNDTIIWADNPAGLASYTMVRDDGVVVPIPPKSATFIASKLTDNPALMRANPEYLANLLSLPSVERERLLNGNWKIRPAAGLYFQRSWCRVVDAVPFGLTFKRGYDLAATPKSASNDPDWTTSTLIGRGDDGRFYVCDHQFVQEGPAGVQTMLRNIAESDGITVEHWLPQDPGSAGKAYATALVNMLSGHNARFSPETGDKVTRFSAFSAQAEAGNVCVLRAPWNQRWFETLEAFPEARHDDDVDSTSRAFNAHNIPSVTFVAPVVFSAPRYSPT